MEPPVFSAALETIRAAPGASASLHVPAPSGTQPFHYEWSRAGASLDDRFTSSDDPGGVRLTVSAARTGDSGVYTLQATNAAGKDTARVRLEVAADEAPTGEDPPTFLRRLQDLTVKVGTRTRFLVEIVSSTECKVTWYRNERRLMEAERVSLVRDGTFWCADIATVSVDDTGRWTCTAENAGGRASCSAHLNVLVPKAYKRPEFVEELRALLTEQGTVSLECKVVGVPTPVLRWFKDSREIKAGDVFALTANAEDPTSLGTYTCEAVNCMGRAYSSSKVHVVGRGSREGSAKPLTSGVTPESPPIFTKELEDKLVRITEPLTLGCHIVVPPWPRSVVWYNKEGKVEPGDRYHVVEDGVGGYMLEMAAAEWPDEGEWKCVATSSGGRIGFSSCYVSMDVPKNYRKPRFMENLQAVLTEEGLVSFECKVVGFPTPVLSWFKDGQELKPGDVYQLTGTNSLGSYCCIAKNCMGQASSSAELTVEDIQNQLNEEEKLQLFSKNQAPKFIQGLKSIEAKIDEPFRFTIKVAIPPEPSVQWYRDDQPIDDSSRCHLAKEERGVFYLDIQSLEFLDQAEWKCVAVNDFGHSVTSCFLKLMIPRHYKKPRFLENLQAILSDEGAVNLECKVIGVPQPVLKWYKDGEELKPGDIHRIISGQDGTCCLGTYTCEAQNCMGIAASSASLLGFDDSMKAKANKKKAEEQALQRNVSLSTIHEERSSQMYDTPVGDITLDDKAEISFSFDGKEVSVSLYETPDLTEEDAIQIMEMYADQISENVTEHNVAELPPLRFVKETSTSGNLLMEAIIIDVSPEYFASPEEDLRTEADVEDISIADENGPPQLSLDQDLGGEDYLERTMDLLSNEKADIVPKKLSRKKSDSQRSADDFYSLSLDQTLSEDKKDDDTQILSESFASARSLGKPKSKSSKPSLEEGQESSDVTKTVLVKDEVQKQAELDTPVSKPKRERRSSRGSRRSSSGSEKSFGKSKDELSKPQVVTLEQVPKKSSMTYEEFKTKMTNVSTSLSKVINDVQIIERDIILKSELMSSAATASRSLEIISSLIKPLSEIHSIADAARESASESKEVSSSLFNNLSQPLKVLQQSLTIIEKCIDVESDNKTLVKKTCVAFIETCGEEVKSFMNEITSITDKEYLTTDQKTVSEINSLVNDMNNVIKFSADTIKTRNLLSEASEIKTTEASVETKHLRDTQKAVFELKSPLNSLLRIVDTADEGKIVDVSNIKSSEVIINDMSASVQDLQAALEQIESLSVKESTTSLHKYNTEIIETVMESVLKLRGSFEQLSVETKNEEDKEVLKHALESIKNNLREISSHLVTIESNVGTFDILQSDNKLETLQKMAQILISLENNLPRLEGISEVKTHMDVFHKNLTRVLENVIESNEAPKYFTLMEVCDAVNRLNTSIKNIDADNVLALSSLSNTLRIIQDTFIKNVFDSELNCSILTNITDVLLSVQEALNHADEISLQLESEHIQDISSHKYETGKANAVIEHIDHTIAIINTVKSVEMTQEMKNCIAPVLENISPVLEEIKRNIASAKLSDIREDEHISEMSDASSIIKTLATPLLELNQNLLVLNQVIVENIDNIKENSEVVSAIAEPLHELHTTLQILQQDIVSQYGEDVAPYDVDVNIISAVQNLQSCIVMVQEQPIIEGLDEMSTLEDISGIKTTAETIPSDRLVLPTAEETAIETSVEPYSQEFAPSATAHALQTLNEHITILQTPEVVDALDTLSEVSDYSSLKSVALGLGELHAGIEEILHPFIMENSNEIANLINTSKLAAIAEPMLELQQSLSILDTSNIPIYEHILEIPSEKIHTVLESISSFKEYLGKCVQALFPAMEAADKTVEISNKVETLREVCETLKMLIENTKDSSTSVKQEIITLEETVDSLLNATDVTKGIQIQQVKAITEELFEKVITVQEELIQYTPHTADKLAEEANLIQAIDEIENNIAVLEQYDFVDLSRLSEITSCATPTLALEMESEPLVQMDDILHNAVNVLQDSGKETPLADLMILEDFFKTCKSEFTIIRLIISKPLSHKKIIRLIQEFTFLQNVIKDFKSKRAQLQLSEDIDGYLKIFFLEADGNLKTIQESLLKVINTQSEILFAGPLTKLENTKELLIDVSKNKDAVFKEVVSKFVTAVELAKPLLQTAQIDMTQELTHPSGQVTTSDVTLIAEKIEELLKFTEEQTVSPSLNEETKEVLNKVTTCLHKHQDYKDATGTGKNLIVLKCLSECAELLQANLLDKKILVQKKIEENTLKAVLTEMLEPLQALHSQLANIQEQVASGIKETSISVDITSTESMIEAVSEIHKDIIQQIESVKTSVDNEEISLVMEADKEIHAIQDTFKSLESIPAVQELKEKSKVIEEVEKSLHNIIASEGSEAQKSQETAETLPKGKRSALIQHIDQFIDLVEVIEEISEVIKVEELQTSANMARELRSNITISETETATGLLVDVDPKRADMVLQLKNYLTGVNVQVLENAQELAKKINKDTLKRFADVTEQLQNDLADVMSVEVAIITPLEIITDDVKEDDTPKNSAPPEDKVVTFESKEKKSEPDTLIKSVEGPDKEKVGLIDENSKIIEETKEIIEEKTVAVIDIDKELISQAGPTSLINISEDVTVSTTVSDMKAATKDTRDTIKTGAIELAADKTEDLKRSIEKFITEDLSGSINKLSAVVDIEELKQTVNIAKELRENIITIKNIETVKENSAELETEKAKQGELVQQLQTALSMVQEQIENNYKQLESVIDTSKLQEIANVTINLNTNLAAAVSLVVQTTPEVVETLKQLVTPDEKLTEKSVASIKEGIDKTHLKTEQVASIKQSEIDSTEVTQPINIDNLSEVKAISSSVKELKVAVSTEVPKSDTLMKSIDDFINEENETIHNLSNLINVEELKQTVNLAKELRENIAAVEDTVLLTSTSDQLELKKEKQGQLVQELQTALLVVQEQIFENFQQLEKVCDASKLQGIADVTVNLQTELASAVTAQSDIKEKSFDSDSTIVPSISLEPIIPADETVVLEETKVLGSILDQTVVSVIDEEQKSVATVKETVTQENKEGNLKEGVEIQTVVMEKVTEADHEKLQAEIMESVSISETGAKEGIPAVESTEATLKEPSIESDDLHQHIEAFISEEIIEAIEELADATNISSLKETVNVAKELLESISMESHPISLEAANILTDKSQAQQAELKETLNEALTCLQTKVIDATQEITPALPVEKLVQISEVITHLQEDLQTATSSSMETFVSDHITESSKEESMKQLENLLQEVSDKIDLSSNEQVPEDHEALRDSLDEVQTVIIKLKRDFDGANDTLNETLEDLECSVRSVQLQINEDSPPELLKEACVTLQLLVNNMSETNEPCVSESVNKDILLKDVLQKCSTDTEQTVQLLEIASNVDIKSQNKLGDIVSNLNKLRDAMKSLRSGFTGTAATLIEKGTDIIQTLDQIEDKVFSIEKEIEAVGNLSSQIRDSIITAVHAVYGSISNMRSTISSTQKQYMFENFGQPSENFLRSIKHLSSLSNNASFESEKAKCKKLSKSLRNVLNHFEDVKFYINLDKTARLPSDAAFTKIILEDLKSNIQLLSSLDGLSVEMKKKIKSSLKCVETNLLNIEARSTLEVKEKIPMFKVIAAHILDTVSSLKSNLEDKVGKESLEPLQRGEKTQVSVDESVSEITSERTDMPIVADTQLHTVEQVAFGSLSVPSHEEAQQLDVEFSSLKAQEKLEDVLETEVIVTKVASQVNDEKIDEIIPSTSKQAQDSIPIQQTEDEEVEKVRAQIIETILSELASDKDLEKLKNDSQEIKEAPDCKELVEKDISISKMEEEQQEIISSEATVEPQPGPSNKLSRKQEDMTKIEDAQQKKDEVEKKEQGEGIVKYETEAKRPKEEIQHIEEKFRDEEKQSAAVDAKQEIERKEQLDLEKAQLTKERYEEEEDKLKQTESEGKLDTQKRTEDEAELFVESSHPGETSSKDENIEAKSVEELKLIQKGETKMQEDAIEMLRQEKQEAIEAARTLKIENEEKIELTDKSETEFASKRQVVEDLPEKERLNEVLLQLEKEHLQNQNEETKHTETREEKAIQEQVEKDGGLKATDKEEEESAKQKDAVQAEELKLEAKKPKLSETQKEIETVSEEAEKSTLEKEKLEQKTIEKERQVQEESQIELLKIKQKEDQENEQLDKEKLEKALLEKDKEDKHKVEQERSEREGQQKENLEQERLEMEKQEEQKLEKERSQEENREKERLEKEKQEKEKQEKERHEMEKQTKEKLDKERLEKELQEKHKLEEKRLKNENQQKAHLEKERLENENQEKEKLEKERLEKENEVKEKEQLKKENQEKEEQERDKLEKERLKNEYQQKKQLEKQRLEKEMQEKEELEKERLEKEKQENEQKEQLEKERLENENQEKEKLEKERLEKENEVKERERLEKENQERDKLEKERLKNENQQKEQLEKQRLEKEMQEKEELEKERLEEEKQENEIRKQERLEKEKQEKNEQEKEKERLKKEKLEKKEKKRIEKEKQEQEKLEKDRLQKEEEEKESLEKLRLEKESQEKEKLENERLEKEKQERDKLEKDRLESEDLEKQKQEKDRVEKKEQERDRIEKDRLEENKQENEKLKNERLEKENQEKEKLQQERLEEEKVEKERLGDEKQEKKEQKHLEKEEKDKLETERLEKERQEKEKLENERLEKERLEKDRLQKENQRLEKEKLENERLEKEKQEQERLEQDKEEKERLEKEKQEQERLEKEKQEKERLEKEEQENQRLEQEKLDKLERKRLEKEKKEKQEKKRLAKEKQEKELLEKEQLEKEKLEKERLEKENQEKERLETEKQEKEQEERKKLEKERLEIEKQENERLEQEKQDKVRLKKEKQEKERLEKEQQEKEKLEKERLKKEKQEKERLEKEEKEKLEDERLEKENQEKEKERIEHENKEKVRLYKEKQEYERLEIERQEKERLEKEQQEQLEKERLDKKKKEKEDHEKRRLEKEEKERLEKEEKERIEKEEKERLEKEDKEKLEKERLEKEKQEKERLEKEKQEKEKLEKELLEKEKKEKKEKKRLEKEKQEKERLEKETQDKEKLEKERLEKEKQEKDKIEKKRLEKEKLENDRIEKERQEKDRLEKEKQDKLERERLEKEKLEQERLEKEQQERERLEKEEKEKLEKDRLEKEKKEKQEKTRLEKEKQEKERLDKEEKEKLEKERFEKEKQEKEKQEKEQLEKEKQEKELQEKEKLEKEHLKKEKEDKERQKKNKLKKERLKKEEQEKHRLEKEKQEKERLELEERSQKEKEEKERLEKEQLKKEILKKDTAEKEKLEKDQLDKEIQENEKQKIEKQNAKMNESEEETRKQSEKDELEKVKKEKTDKKPKRKSLEDKKLKQEDKTSEKDEKLTADTLKMDNGDIDDGKKKKKDKVDSEEHDKKTHDTKYDRDTHNRKENILENNSEIKSTHRDKQVTERSDIILLDEKEIRARDTFAEIDYSRQLKSETKLAHKAREESQNYIKEYHYEPSTRPKYEEREKPRFVDHNHRDYTMEFARPSAYREKTMEVDNVSFEKNTGRGHIYKASTLMMDAQLRSSAPPRGPPDTNRSSEPVEKRPEVDRKQRSKALSEARSIISEKRTVSRDIRRKPVFSTYLTDRTAVEGSRVKLTCSVLSSTDPKITWYKNGVILDNKLKYRTKFTDGLITLEVLNAVPSDSAEYSCTVDNENGSVNTSANLKVYPSFEASPIPPTFTRSIRDTFHLAENELVLECRIRGQPLPTITWLKDDRPISTSDRYQAYYLADGVCRLAINHPTPADSGKYTCKAENSVWSDQITHIVNFTGKESRLSPNLTTVERSRFNRQTLESSRRPHFGNVLTDYKVSTGGTIGLQVEIRGAPTRVEWLREGRSVTETYTNARTYVEQGLYTLALSDVTERESGLYTCRAFSSHGTVDMNAAITVVQPNEMEGKPAIIAGRPEKDVLISVGEDLNISFRAQGEPKPKVMIMKGIRDITTSQRVCKMTSDDYVKFTVKRSVISDAGTYCILARNAYGCDRAFVTVVVRQRASSENLISDWTYPMDDSALSITERKYKSVPDRIPGEPAIVDGGNNWVSIAWPKPDPRDAAPVLAYKVESWLAGKEGGARWTELGITPLNSFDAFNLKQGEQYHFRVTPRNRYGWGEAVQTASPIGVGLAGDRPEFIDILPGQLKVLIGQKASLSCSVKGKPIPEVVWMKNGHEIDEEDARVKASFNGYSCNLTINGIEAEDEARYSCEASNVHGRASTYARLAVVADRLIWEADVKLKRERSADAAGEYPPQFTMRLRDRRVQATYPVRLTCQVVGSPAPSVTWFKDGEEVILDSRHTKSQDEHFHTLEIAPTTLEDGGFYEAMARNGSGAISCHCSLVVDKGIRAYVAPEFCCGLEPLYRLNEGEELRVTAVVEAYPTVGVTWYRDGVRLRPSRRAIMTLDRDGQIELALAFVTPRDAGVYTCTASNEVGRASTSGKVEVIEGDAAVVKRRAAPVVISPDVPYSKEPMFIRKPRSSEAREGDTVIIQCEVVGDPKPDVYWLRDFLKPDYYRDATHFKRVGDGPEYRFEIPHAKLDYTGAYSVVARNVHGEAKAIISLQILARDPSSTEEHNVRYGRVDVIPRFEKNLTDLLCHDGDAIEFECHVSGHPEPDIRWFHYTELIRECPDFEWSLEEGTARLKIKQVTAEDEGTYLCEASNNLGKATSSACLVVYPPGEPNMLSQRLRRPPALLSAASTPRSTPRSTPARSVSRTPGPDPRRLCSPSRQMPPKFYTYPFNKVVEEGDHVIFQCAVKGLPAPWATWDKDGVIITPSSRITIREKDEILRILEIEEVTIEDVGIYRVTLENDYGRVEASARLEVITQKGKFYAGVRAYSASPRKSLPYRRRSSSSRQD